MINKIYARTNEIGIVANLFSSVFEQPLESDIFIEEGNEEYHAHVHLKYIAFDEYGRANYRSVNGILKLIPEAEKPPVPPPEPTLEERTAALEAAMLAMMEV